MWVEREKRQVKKIEKKNEAKNQEILAMKKWENAKIKREMCEGELENLKK